jgi:hypothetical protein
MALWSNERRRHRRNGLHTWPNSVSASDAPE